MEPSRRNCGATDQCGERIEAEPVFFLFVQKWKKHQEMTAQVSKSPTVCRSKIPRMSAAEELN
jgi:hypothetical protein